MKSGDGLKVLQVASEAAPFAKVGGLADMVGSLPKALIQTGADVRVVIPKYGFIAAGADWKAHDDPLYVHLGYGVEEFARVWETVLPGSDVPVYLIEFNRYYQRSGVYDGPEGGYIDNDRRYAFLCRAALELGRHLDWQPDVFHCHDWHTGLLPVYLNTWEVDGSLGRCASVFTVHNMQHQGIFPREILDFAGLPGSVFRPDDLESVGYVNMMKGGLYNATKLTAVSPHYAREIQTSAYGCGLDSVLRFRSADLIGVLNGADVQSWNPATDPHIPANFSAEDMTGKTVCKGALQDWFGLKKKSDMPVYGVVARLWDQKGLDLLAGIAHWLMQEMRIQLAILGSGDPGLEDAFRALGARYPGRIGVHIGFNERLAHLIEAGSDFFIMPSRFEPCGLNQMYSQMYGTLPIVRGTGGLVDTVENYDEATGVGTGFIFYETSMPALYYTIGWSCATYYDRPDAYRRLQQQAMAKDFSWDRSAQAYLDVYTWARDARLEGLGLIQKKAAAARERRAIQKKKAAMWKAGRSVLTEKTGRRS